MCSWKKVLKKKPFKGCFSQFLSTCTTGAVNALTTYFSIGSSAGKKGLFSKVPLLFLSDLVSFAERLWKMPYFHFLLVEPFSSTVSQ